MRLYVLFIVLTVLSVGTPAHAKGTNLGEVGMTYEIAEPDALLEIENRAKSIDWAKVMSKERHKEKIKSFVPENAVQLAKATESKAYLVDMTYTLERDIPDGKGGILYPKGYTFNPLDYVALPNILVIIDGKDLEQRAWFKSSRYADDYRVMLLISGGSYYEVMNDLKRPVYYTTRELVERLKLRATPSVVVQQGKMMEVNQVVVEKSTDTRGN